MKFVILSGNPKSGGLCRSVTDEIVRGAEESGAEVSEIDTKGMSYCRVCGDGWGSCGGEHKCAYGDDGFAAAQEALRQADAAAIVTPVYWSEMAEGLKSFLDRFRRCEHSVGFNERKGALAGKPVLLVASPGGGGRGALTTLQQLERFCDHTGAKVFDFIGVNRWNSDYKKNAAYAAAKALAGGRNVGETC
ncbi:flavodoxin family protein [Clostridia bacterium]|nr:flavodoxin family protein [Clostridia bacterium]